MTRRRAPRRISEALGAVLGGLAPDTPLAAVQGVWRGAVGDPIAARATPAWERDGVVGVACESAIWAAELDLMQSQLLVRLNAALGSELVRGLRFSVSEGPDG